MSLRKILFGVAYMPRLRHPNQTVESVIRYAEAHGWRVRKLGARAHGWGKLLCPHNDDECRCGEYCITVIWSTPRNPEVHARQLRRVVDGCIGISRRVE